MKNIMRNSVYRIISVSLKVTICAEGMIEENGMTSLLD